MKRSIITTADGSKTILIEDWKEQYHSKHGALQEAQYVFVQMGLQYLLDLKQPTTIRLLEIGFGTGLNAFLTAIEYQNKNIQIQYHGLDAYPVNRDELKALNYGNLLGQNHQVLFEHIHQAKWGEWCRIQPQFSLKKSRQLIADFREHSCYDLIYFDAFGARVQPELWTKHIFQQMYEALAQGGVLVTYSAKGSVRRAMQTVGFEVERLQGPPGKREMLRATKA